MLLLEKVNKTIFKEDLLSYCEIKQGSQEEIGQQKINYLCLLERIISVGVTMISITGTVVFGRE